jgi:hypothetical protein
MKRSLMVASGCLLGLLVVGNAQDGPQNSTSVFDNRGGEYSGTVNGVIFLRRSSGEDCKAGRATFTTLDFQRGSARLQVVHDEEEMYDSHTESFVGFTTSARSTVTYSTYAQANKLQIKVGGDTYEVSTIDGASDTKVPGIEATYHLEEGREYLVLRFSQEVQLDNVQPLLRQSDLGKTLTVEEELRVILKKTKCATILPQSVLVYVIEDKSLNSLTPK